MVSRGKDIVAEVRKMDAEKAQVSGEIDKLRADYEVLLEKYQPVIASLSLEADMLAGEFRRLYRESQDAFQNDQKELAKTLSEAGHKAQEQCQDINSRANTIRRKLKILLSKIEERQERVTNLSALIKDLRSKLTEDLAPVRGFAKSGIMGNLEVQEFLAQFPKKVFSVIDAIQYNDKYSGDRRGTKLGVTQWSDKTKKATIIINRHVQISPSEKGTREDFKMTIGHEIGHIVFVRFMADTERWNWGNWYIESRASQSYVTPKAQESRSDDFAECFAVNALNPKMLENFDSRRYSFIKELNSRLIKE